MIRYFPASGDRLGWAIDEDLRLIRRALQGEAAESTLGCADIVHAPFWVWLPKILHDPEVLRRKFVIAHADNPPFFYLTQPEFAWAQEIVDLWVARSTEAQTQFEKLGLPSIHIPYAIDTSLFFPITEKENIRQKYGLPKDTYIIGNFHRDSDGADLTKPKHQKSPEMMVAILRHLKQRGKKFHVLLAGPRRHWIRKALTEAGILYTFVGKQGLEGDDLYANILERQKLNELYNACDLYLVTSRWEGGPQSVMEAAASRTKILSPPLGVALDVLEKDTLFDLAPCAAEKIARDIETNFLSSSLKQHFNRIFLRHNADAMAKELRKLYRTLPNNSMFRKKTKANRRPLYDMSRNIFWKLKCRLGKAALVSGVRILHVAGHDKILDEAMVNIQEILQDLGVSTKGGIKAPAIAGNHNHPASYRLLPPDGRVAVVHPETCYVALSVNDAVNFRRLQPKSKILVCPLIFRGDNNKLQICTIHCGDAWPSLKIQRAILARRPVIYPRKSFHYYQIFQAGIAYGKNRSLKEARKIAITNKQELIDLAIPTNFLDAKKFWQKLLQKIYN